MKQMIQHRLSWPFRRPVDAVKMKVPNYYDVIKEPMDLATIEKKLKTHAYRTAKECITDFNRVFSNCYIFNQPDDEVVATAKELEKFFLDKLAGMPTIEWEIEADAKSDSEGRQGREASGLQDHLSSYFSAGVQQRKRQSIERLVVGGSAGSSNRRRSLAGGEKVGVQVGLDASKSKPQVDKEIKGSHSGEYRENRNQFKRSSGNKLKDQHDFKDEKGKTMTTTSRKVMKEQVYRGKNSYKGEGESLVRKVGKRCAGGTQSVTREERDLRLKCSEPSALPKKSSQSRGSLDPLISNMIQSLKEVSRSHESMSSITVEEVLMKHNMRQMKDKLDLLRNCMEVAQKDPQNSNNLKASVAKLEGALLPGQHGTGQRSKHAEYSRRPYTDWGELAASRRNSVDLVNSSVVGEERQCEKGENCGTPGPSLKRSPTEVEDDISDLLGSEDEGGKEVGSPQIIKELVREILNKVGQPRGNLSHTY